MGDDTTTMLRDWLDETTRAFASERALDDAASAGESTLAGLEAAGEFSDLQIMRAARASALLHALAGRVGRGDLSDTEAQRRAAVILLADPACEGIPHRCARCNQIHYLMGDDWLSAGREDLLCFECTVALGAAWEQRASIARAVELSRGVWRRDLRRMPRPALPAPRRRAVRTRRRAAAGDASGDD
jgi:hypothetical protein